jgi:hypothetical protein
LPCGGTLSGVLADSCTLEHRPPGMSDVHSQAGGTNRIDSFHYPF